VISGAAQRPCRDSEDKSERAEDHDERKEVANGSSAAAPAVGVGGMLLFEGEGEPKESEGVAVSIFPTKILLASDGSEEAELALNASFW
jgi:hypothetical protein